MMLRYKHTGQTWRELPKPNTASPIALRCVDHRQPVLPLDSQLHLRGLQVALKRVHTANVEPHILLQTEDGVKEISWRPKTAPQLGKTEIPQVYVHTLLRYSLMP